MPLFSLWLYVVQQYNIQRIGKKNTLSSLTAFPIAVSIISGVGLSIALVGIRFKFQALPGATIQLYLGLFFMLVVSLIALLNFKKDPRKLYSTILKRTVFFSLLCVTLICIPIKTWLTFQYPENPEYVNAVFEYKKNPENDSLRLKMEEEHNKMIIEHQGGKE